MRAFLAGLLVALFFALPANLRATDVAGHAQAFRALQSSVSLVMLIRDKDDKVVGETSGCAGVIAAARRVLTAFHCVRGAGESGKILVRPYADQKRLLKTALVWHRVGIDLAVLETAEDIPGKIAELAPDVAVGEGVIAIGSPDSDEFVVTRGIVSKIVIDRFENCRADDPLGWEYHQILYTDTMLFFGNSGGGLFNGNGQLVGISERVAVVDAGNDACALGYLYKGEHIMFGYFVGLNTLRTLRNVPPGGAF